jgi:hypothetical protein
MKLPALLKLIKSIFILSSIFGICNFAYSQSQYINSTIRGQDSQFTYLGVCSSNAYRFDSILNAYGQYGSSVSSYSIRNSFSIFGSSFSAYSAYNSFAAYPPIIYNSAGIAQAYLTKNVLLSPRIDPDLLIIYLRELGSASVGSNAILMSSPISYSATGRTSGAAATLNVEQITNYRPVGTTSNALSLRLYATSSEYISGTLVGYKLVEIPLGASMGGYVYNKISVTGVLAAPPNGNYNMVMVLAEWNGFEYIIVDWGNFPKRESFGIIESAPVILTQPTSATISSGGNITFTASASGTPAPSYQWKKDGSLLAGATSSTYSISSATKSDAGIYTVVATNSVGSVASNAAALTVTATVTAATAPRLSNLSVRTALDANQIVIVGVTMSGGSKNVLLRAVGPTLSAFGVPSVMADPKLDLYSGSTKVTTNDNWGGSSVLSSAFQSVGAFAYSSTASLDAALVTSIDGGRTVQVSGPTSGTVLVEGYDAGTGDTQRFTNLSARNKVGTGANILIAGFTLTGSGTRNLLIRAVGPKLSDFGVTGVLADPKLEIYSGSTKLTENDNWASSLAATFSSVGAFGLTSGSKDAAITVSLAAGGYTVQVSGADGGVGEAIVEIYELP